MKKPQLNTLVTITAIFTAFILGFFLGRNYNHTDIQLSAVPPVADAQPAESTAAQLAARSSEETDLPSTTKAPSPVETAETQPSEDARLQAEVTQPPTEAPQAETGTPAETEAPQSETELPPETETSVSSGLININTATRAELETLPGIGEVLAQRIIDYRETYGPFTTVTQLTNVSGIGDKRLAAIIDLVTVG